MPKRLINESITVVRGGKRVMPEIGKAFELTNDEIKSLEEVRPQAISSIKGVEVDPQSKPVADESDLSKLDKAGLVALAEKLKVVVPKNANEAKLVELIEAARKSDDL
jgi:hypothetical protein